MLPDFGRGRASEGEDGQEFEDRADSSRPACLGLPDLGGASARRGTGAPIPGGQGRRQERPRQLDLQSFQPAPGRGGQELAQSQAWLSLAAQNPDPGVARRRRGVRAPGSVGRPRVGRRAPRHLQPGVHSSGEAGWSPGVSPGLSVLAYGLGLDALLPLLEEPTPGKKQSKPRKQST